MRFMKRLMRYLVFWAISLPLIYVFALPPVAAHLQTKLRSQQYSACQKELRDQRLIGTPTGILREEEARDYCRCVSDALILDRNVLLTLAGGNASQQLHDAMKPAVDACNDGLKQRMNAVIQTLPKPRSVRGKDGVETVYFN